jgi:biotin carboxylase
MGKRVALAAGYVNAGTVESLWTRKNRKFYFKMNTLLQVMSILISELITGKTSRWNGNSVLPQEKRAPF